jgi:hypothetical protein
MAEAAQSEGRVYGDAHREHVTSLKLEKEFGFISKHLLKKDVYRHGDYLFDSFTAAQKRQLFYIVSLMSREYLRKNRRKIASLAVQGRSTEEVRETRSFHTFRVEET